MPAGVYVIGKAIGDFELRTFQTKTGRTIQIVEGQVLAGKQFVKVEQTLDPGEKPILLQDNDEVVAPVVPHYSADGLLKVQVKLKRPNVGG
ncbi:hypothetical protein [Synoicihabitans lomoniglobus]|uniref:Uncharacterized protein n=1 Tax=Synoicihabitans lomoniglobus TaxID=2909285 RepID=A0AAF0I494_9BACT|nr:hypothetical protein [Opitutaceae bacterium LMO-M01]WED66718.1 hypothetical protein PXH66_07630 [Opitutaceae bacterium LMO-M01]